MFWTMRWVRAKIFTNIMFGILMRRYYLLQELMCDLRPSPICCLFLVLFHVSGASHSLWINVRISGMIRYTKNICFFFLVLKRKCSILLSFCIGITIFSFVLLLLILLLHVYQLNTLGMSIIGLSVEMGWVCVCGCVSMALCAIKLHLNSRKLPGWEERCVPALIPSQGWWGSPSVAGCGPSVAGCGPSLAEGDWSGSGDGLDDWSVRDDGLLDGGDDWCYDLAVAVNNAGRLVRDGGWDVLDIVSGDGWFNHARQNWLVGDDLLGDEWLVGNEWSGFNSPWGQRQWGIPNSGWGWGSYGDGKNKGQSNLKT